MKRKTDFYIALLLILMAWIEIASIFIAFPGIIGFVETQTEWYYEYLPVVCLVNGLIASILLMFAGVKRINLAFAFSNQEHDKPRFLIAIKRWREKKKYGYIRSEYILK